MNDEDEKVRNLMGQRIHQMRKEHALTLTELGKMLGVGDSAVSKWEKGRVQNIPRDTIEQMAKIFGCEPVWLMGYDKEESDSITIQFKSDIDKTYFEKILPILEDEKKRKIFQGIIDSITEF